MSFKLLFVVPVELLQESFYNSSSCCLTYFWIVFLSQFDKQDSDDDEDDETGGGEAADDDDEDEEERRKRKEARRRGVSRAAINAMGVLQYGGGWRGVGTTTTGEKGAREDYDTMPRKMGPLRESVHRQKQRDPPSKIFFFLFSCFPDISPPLFFYLNFFFSTLPFTYLAFFNF